MSKKNQGPIIQEPTEETTTIQINWPKIRRLAILAAASGIAIGLTVWALGGPKDEEPEQTETAPENTDITE